MSIKAETPSKLLEHMRFTTHTRASEVQRVPLIQDDPEMIFFRVTGLHAAFADYRRERNIAVSLSTGDMNGVIKRGNAAFALDTTVRGKAFRLRPNVGQMSYGDDHARLFGNFDVMIDQALLGHETTRSIRYAFPENTDYNLLDKKLMAATALIDIADGRVGLIELEQPPMHEALQKSV